MIDHAGLVERLQDVADSIRLYEGGPSDEEGAVRDAAILIEEQADLIASIPELIEKGRREAFEEAARALDARADGFHEAARRQGKKVGPLAVGFTEAAKIIRALGSRSR